MIPEGTDARPRATVPSGGIGPTLRAARERRGLSIAAITETLHVDSRMIEAMEAGRFAVFDAPVYARGFIRKYAGFLELPADELIAAYDALSGGPPPPTLIPLATAAPPPRDLSKLRLPAIFVLALAFVAASLWWWMGRAHGPATASAPGATVTTLISAAPPAADPGATEPPPPLLPAPTEAERVALADRPIAKAADARRSGVSATLTLKGLRECWVEVYSPSGARLFYDLVQPGDSHALPGPGPWKVFLGNAEGVQLSVGEHALTFPAGVRAGATARFVVSASGAIK